MNIFLIMFIKYYEFHVARCLSITDSSFLVLLARLFISNFSILMLVIFMSQRFLLAVYFLRYWAFTYDRVFTLIYRYNKYWDNFRRNILFLMPDERLDPLVVHPTLFTEQNFIKGLRAIRSACYALVGKQRSDIILQGLLLASLADENYFI